jgi:uncharacterized membrane protein
MRRYERFVEIDAPVERVFDLFADFEDAPRWMGGVRAVWRTGRHTFLWIAETALDLDVEWQAEVIVFEPDRRIVWRSFRGDVRADCEAVFSMTPRGTTLMRVVRGYDTPGGYAGERVARFFGRHPARQLEEDMARLKRIAERVARGRHEEDARARRGRGGVRPETVEREEGRVRRPRHALTPRERQSEREREREFRRAEEERRAADWYLRRGVDRLLERPRGEARGRRE